MAAGWFPGAAFALVASAAAIKALIADAKAGLTSADRALESMHARIADACSDVEHAVSAFVSAPAVAAARANAAASHAVEATVRQAGTVILAAYAKANSVHILSTILRIIIQTYRSVFLCTLQLIVQTIAAVVDAATHAISYAVHDAARLLRQAIQTVVASGEGLADMAVDGANAVLGIFGKHINPPKLAVPALQYVLAYTRTRKCYPSAVLHRSP